MPQYSNQERAFTGTWVIPEIKLAVSQGYKILDVFEIHKYESMTGIFSGFVNNFLKMKQESSGYPRNCITEEQKIKYTLNYFENEGINLDREKISFNGGLRLVAKLILNSLWGKFVMRFDNKSQVIFPKTYSEINDVLTNEDIEIKSIKVLNDTSSMVTYKFINNTGYEAPYINVPIGAYTTALARIKLYEIMKKLGEKVLYVDTDSAIYVDDGTLDIKCGDYLGDLTDEIDEGLTISEFATTGPKSYSLKLLGSNNEIKYITKCKGFTINSKSDAWLNFDNYKELIFEKNECGNSKIITTEGLKIKRKAIGSLITVNEIKRFKFTYDKRLLKGDFDTHPYGYIK